MLPSLQTKPVQIQARRWDPISGGSSAVVSTTMDLIGCLTGMVSKPMEERKIDTRRRARDKKRLDAKADTDTTSLTSESETPRLHDVDGASMRSSRSQGGTSAGTAAAATAKSIGMIAPTALKALMADIPYAMAEGFRTMPQHYNDKVRDHGAVVDCKSGAVVAGKTFAWGFIDGLSGVVTLPYAGAKKEGALGAAKGLGKGVASLITKTGAGMFGVVAYPSMGIAKSVRNAVYSGTQKQIAKERHREGEWLLATGGISEIDADRISEVLYR